MLWQFDISFLSERKVDIISNLNNVVNTLKAKRILGFEPKITLEAGIQETVTWYIQKLKK